MRYYQGGREMIIDFHTHIFPDFLAQKAIHKLEKMTYTKAFVDGTLEGLQESMEEAKVDLSVLLPVATSPKQVVTCNNGAIEINQMEPNKFISFGAMHPDFEDYKEELKRIKNAGIKGIKLHPDYQETMFDDIRYKRIIDVATELDFIISIHAGLDIGLCDPIHATPKRIRNVIQEVQPKKLVLAHMGGFQLWEEVLAVLGGEEVYFDTAFSLGDIKYWDVTPVDIEKLKMMATEQFMEFLNVFGEDRILFATDSPWCGQKEMIVEIEKLPLSREQKEKILGGNAAKLLQLACV